MAKVRTKVLVLGGGPDAEREVSILSARSIGDALERSGRFDVERRTIDRLSLDELGEFPGDVIFPVLHGGWGEGGPLQDLLEADGRPFVGSGSHAARAAMDKVATKFAAARLGVPTPPAHIADLRDAACPLDFPVVVKPVHEGSTIGLFICAGDTEWVAARRAIEQAAAEVNGRVFMIEPCITGDGPGGRARELTVGVLDGTALPIIEIVPADGLYDYQAKYIRNDTRYILDPPLPSGVRERIQEQTERLARELGARHLARADFMLDSRGLAWFLEINTMPGFTDHSLVPMAARHAGLDMPELCTRLVQFALRDAGLADAARVAAAHAGVRS